MITQKEEIYHEALGRGIDWLFHFTPASNIESILTNGLMSRQDLYLRGIAFSWTDDLRLDDNLDAISLSVESINESMLSAKIKRHRVDWVILGVKASVLWTHQCLFSWENAAERSIRNHRGYRGGLWAFRKMFEDRPMGLGDLRSARETRRLLLKQPTENAAEVQVLSPIHPDFVQGAIVRTEAVRASLEATMRAIGRVRPVVVDDSYFMPKT